MTEQDGRGQPQKNLVERAGLAGRVGIALDEVALPAGVERTSCLTLECAECFQHPNHDSGVGVPHYRDLAELMGAEVGSCKGSLADCGDRGPDFHQRKDGAILCLACAHQADCADGHFGPFDASGTDRICEHCDDVAPLEAFRGIVG